MSAADLILLLHVAVILFVLLLPLLVVLRRRNAMHWWRSRLLHLLLTGYIAAQSVVGFECPLTTWENQLRVTAGQAVYGDQGFIAGWLHRLIFFDASPAVFSAIYIGFFVLVCAGFWWAPLRRRAFAPAVDASRMDTRVG